jgi:hypothetical protein
VNWRHQQWFIIHEPGVRFLAAAAVIAAMSTARNSYLQSLAGSFLHSINQTMAILFWICWIAELGVVLWWIITDAKQTHMEANPYSYLSLVYLLAVLGVRLGLHANSVSNAMVMIPAIPLLGLGLIIVVSVLSGKKWN